MGLHGGGVCTENLVRIELVMESRHACGDDRADLPGPQPANLFETDTKYGDILALSEHIAGREDV